LSPRTGLDRQRALRASARRTIRSNKSANWTTSTASTGSLFATWNDAQNLEGSARLVLASGVRQRHPSQIQPNHSNTTGSNMRLYRYV
jgi:hypothetical protein